MPRLLPTTCAIFFVAGWTASNYAVLALMIGGVVCGLAVAVWWLFFSRAPWPERVGAIVVIAGAVYWSRGRSHA